MTQANPHPLPIELVNYGHITPDTTLHGMLEHLVRVSSVLGRDGVLPQDAPTPMAERVSYSLAQQLMNWVRDSKPTCGVLKQEPGSTHAQFYECELLAFHEGNHVDDNAEWP